MFLKGKITCGLFNFLKRHETHERHAESKALGVVITPKRYKMSRRHFVPGQNIVATFWPGQNVATII